MRSSPSVALLPVLAAALLASTLAAQEPPVAFVGARLEPVAAPAIADGVLVAHRGTIAAIGPRGEVAIPDGARVVDVSGRVVMPGLVCTHSHVAQPSGGDRSAPIHPDCRVIDAIDVLHPSVHRARAGGLTTLHVMPGSSHLLSGQTVYLKLRRGDSVEELAIRDEDGAIAGAMKMANGTNPQKDPPFPETRARAAALVRRAYVEAEEYREKVRRAEAGDGEAPKRDLALEALVEVLDGKRVVHHHTHRHDDILTVLRLREEFGFRLVLQHVTGGWRVAEEIAAAGVPCSLTIVDSPGGKQEVRSTRWENAAILERAGVNVGFNTDDPITDSRVYLRAAQLAVRGGMSREGALRGLTLAGAEMLDLGDRTGSLEVGKDADLVVLSGDPLSVYTKVRQTWVEGVKVFDIEDPADRTYAYGGEGAGDETTFHGCCIGEEGGR
ncbi:MAG: amidohydrolase family protein [Planctomycetota bacterium JB042]